MTFGRRIIYGGISFAVVAVGGCARIPRDAGFADVKTLVGERMPQRVEWNRGSADDAATDGKVDAMLGGELTADAAVQVALLNNKDLQATYESLAVAQADLVEAGLLLNPVFDAQFRISTAGAGPGVDVGIIQDFLDVFQIPLRKRVSAANFEATKSQVAGAVVDLAAETKRTYFQLVAALQTIELRQTVVDAYAASYDLAKRLHDAGNITDLALAREQGQYEQSKLDLAASEVDARVRREQLAALMGVWGERAAKYRVPSGLPEASDQPLDASDLERTAVANSLNLGQIRQQVFADVSRLGLSSNLALLDRSSLSAGAVAERSGKSGDWEVGPAFALPIPLFNTGRPAVFRAKAVVRAANRRYQQEAVNLRAGVRAAAQQLAGARARAEYYRRVLMPIRQTIVDQTQLTYNAMLVGPFQLLQAKRDQVEAATAYIGALETYWLARTTLEQILAGRSGGFPAMAPAEMTSPATNGGDAGGH